MAKRLGVGLGIGVGVGSRPSGSRSWTPQKYLASNYTERSGYSFLETFSSEDIDASIMLPVGVFNGVNDALYRTIPSTGGYFHTTNSGSIKALVYAVHSTTGHQIFSCAKYSDTNYRVNVAIIANKPRFNIKSGNDVYNMISTASEISVGWHIVEFGSTGSAYWCKIDGVDAPLASPANGFNNGKWFDDVIDTNTLSIGALYTTPTGWAGQGKTAWVKLDDGAAGEWHLTGQGNYCYDVSGNGLNMTYVGAGARAEYVLGYGSTYLLDNGWAKWTKNAVLDEYVPYGADTTELVAAGYSLSKTYSGSLTGINFAPCRINFNPSGTPNVLLANFNRADTEIFTATARGATYDASNPYVWRLEDFQRQTMTSWYNTHWKYMVFPKIEGNSVSGRDMLLEILNYNAMFRSPEYIYKILEYTGDQDVVTNLSIPVVEIDQLYYKYETIHVDCAIHNYALANSLDRVWMSSDGGLIYDKTAKVTGLGNKLQFSRVFRNGKVIFGNNTVGYQSTAALASIEPLPFKEKDGVTDLTLYPGQNFNLNNVPETIFINGKELFIWSNYGNFTAYTSPVGDGPNETNIFAMWDDDVVLKSVYKFGQNPLFTLGGTPYGGTPIGDPSNPIICRHGHGIHYDPSTGKFILATGDWGSSPNFECHLMEGVINPDNSFTWTVVFSGDTNSWYKTSGEHIWEGYQYFAMDSSDPAKSGVFKCLPQDRGDYTKYTKLYDTGVVLGNFTMFTKDQMTARYTSTRSLLLSRDAGETFDLLSLTSGIASSIHFWRKDPPNSKGWMRCEASTTRGDFTQNTLWIKIK